MKLLIVEDDIGLHKQYQWGIQKYTLFFATNRDEAFKALCDEQPELVLLDMGLPPDPDNASEGLYILNLIMSQCPNTKVVVLTGSEQRDHALQAAAMGAFDYLNKGIDLSSLQLILDRAAYMRSLEEENRALREEKFTGGRIIGNSPALVKATQTMVRISTMPVSTILSGESGVGKEVFAQSVHELSGRKGKFVAINCASIPENLLESELFGHSKGAFTGAVSSKPGKVRQADNGTLFLDEIGDMPMELQAKMLRFLQERKVEPVGGGQPVSVNVRVLCATHCNLKKMVDEGRFRSDLYYRLSEFTLHIPPLRDRDADILLLGTYFLNKYRDEFMLSGTAKEFSHAAKTALMNHPWPGNVRELQNLIKSAVIVCQSALVSPEDLGLQMEDGEILIPKEMLQDGGEDDEILSINDIRRIAESKALYLAYRKAEGNISLAARMLKVTRPTFYSLADKHGIRYKEDEAPGPDEA